MEKEFPTRTASVRDSNRISIYVRGTKHTVYTSEPIARFELISFSMEYSSLSTIGNLAPKYIGALARGFFSVRTNRSQKFVTIDVRIR